MNATASKTRTDKVREAGQLLDRHVQALIDQMAQGKSENLIRYLEFSSRFHSYSFGNILLIALQCPAATRVAGLRQWNKLGRHVRSGEKGIMILAPMTVPKRVKEEKRREEADEGEKPERITLFKAVYVFDVAQTEGQELPGLLHASGDAHACLPALKEAVRKRGIQLEELERVPGHASASGVSLNGRIVIRNDLDPPEAFRTLAHEFAHEFLHWPKDGSPKETSKTIRETEADATAFVVCRRFGITCDSSDYLLLYDADAKLLSDRLEIVRSTAARIIEAVESALGISAGTEMPTD